MRHAIVSDHVFVDGNKRTGTLAALYILGTYGLFDANENPTLLQVRILGDVALEAAASGLPVEDVTEWMIRIFRPVRAS